MKIAIDVSQMCYEGTGVARYVKGLTKSLLELNSGHSFVFLAGTLRQTPFFKSLKKTSPWNKANWKLIPVPPKLAGMAFNLLPLKIESLLGSIDLFHSSDWSSPKSICPSVTTVHDLVFMKYPETVEKLILSTQTMRLARIVNGTTHIIADSMSTKNDLMEIYNLKSDRIDVVYPGIDDDYCVQSNQEIDRVKTKYNLPEQYILSLGTQEPRKNVSRLIDAVKDLDLPLVVVGKHGWGSKTKSLGFVPDSDIKALYSGASVFAYPSLYEGFGFPVLEAMACGTPVVTSDISSLPEIVEDAGILVDPKSVESIRSGIVKALGNRDLYIKLGMAQAKKFSWVNTAKQTLEVYEKTANRN